MNILFKVFEDSGVKLITDLPISRSCNIITDAVIEEEIGYEVAHSEAYADVSSGGELSLTLATVSHVKISG